MESKGVEGIHPGGFMLVTVDPLLRSGRHGHAWFLVRERLCGGRWPLFANTPNCDRLAPRTPLSFYVGGEDRYSGCVVGVATVGQVVPWPAGRGPIDPPKYDTDVPVKVIDLSEVKYLHPPFSFRELLPKLTICPTTLKKWGVVLMGGVRAIPSEDWKILFDGRTFSTEVYQERA